MVLLSCMLILWMDFLSLDTVFHLNDEGVGLRTDQLIADLQNWMNQ